MVIIAREKGESVTLTHPDGQQQRIKIHNIAGKTVRLAIDAPLSVAITRTDDRSTTGTEAEDGHSRTTPAAASQPALSCRTQNPCAGKCSICPRGKARSGMPQVRD